MVLLCLAVLLATGAHGTSGEEFAKATTAPQRTLAGAPPADGQSDSPASSTTPMTTSTTMTTSTSTPTASTSTSTSTSTSSSSSSSTTATTTNDVSKLERGKLEIAVVGGGVAGTVQVLELLRLRDEGENVGHITVFEHGETIGNSKSASGIIAAILGFASTHKYWDSTTPFAKLQKWLAMRVEQPSARFFMFLDRVSSLVISNDRRIQEDFQMRFFNASRMHMETLLDKFPSLCAAIVGPFCCRPGTPARAWMDKHGGKHNVWCERPSGVAHVFAESTSAVCDEARAREEGLDLLLSEKAKVTFPSCNIPQKHAGGTNTRVGMRTLETLMDNNLFAALWNHDDEGFVRVEDFYPAALDIFEKYNVTVHKKCSVQYVQPGPRRNLSDAHKMIIKTDFTCGLGGAAQFDRVVVAAGANSVNLLKRHDRDIPYQLMPVKGYAVATNEAVFQRPALQIGFEYEDLGHYIRAQKNGGIRYGFGRELGLFDDQLLNPTFEGWKPGTGPNQTGVGREVVSKKHVGLAGFRPLSAFMRFPLLKRYTGSWAGLFVNTGYGFYGYGMAWKSAEIVASLTLGDQCLSKLESTEYADTWLDEEGPLICPASTVSFSAFVLLCCGVSALFVAFTWYCAAQPVGEIAVMEDLFENPMLDETDKEVIATSRSDTSHTESLMRRYHKAVELRTISAISHNEFEDELGNLRREGRKIEPAQRRNPACQLDFKALHDILRYTRWFLWYHIVSALLALSYGVFGFYTGIFVVIVVKAGTITLLQRRAIASCLRPWCEEQLPHHLFTWRRAAEVPDPLWRALRSVVDAVDNEIDGANAGTMLLHYLVFKAGSWLASALWQGHDGEDQVTLATDQYQQLMQCTPFIGFIGAFVGPYLGIVLHTCFYISVQTFCSFKYLKKASQELEKLEALERKGTCCDESSDEAMCTWNEFWRHSCHAFDLCGLFELQGATERLCNVTSDTVRTLSLRMTKQRSANYHGRYGKLSKFSLKVVLESAGSMVLLSSTSMVTYNVLTTKQVVFFAVSVMISTYSVLEHVLFQLQHHDDVQANMKARWYGMPGFWVNRCLVVLVFCALLISWEKLVGIFFCPSHAFDPIDGCLALEDPELYELHWTWPCYQMDVIYVVVSLLFVAFVAYFLYLFFQRKKLESWEIKELLAR